MFSPPRSPKLARLPRTPRTPPPRTPRTPPRRHVQPELLSSLASSRSSWLGGLFLVNLVTVMVYMNMRHIDDHRSMTSTHAVRKSWASDVTKVVGKVKQKQNPAELHAAAIAKLSNQQAKAPNAATAPVQVRGSYFAMCAIVKDQHADIREWVQYHHWLGAVKFYIYDHNSSVPVMDELDDWIKAGIVEYTAFSGHHRLKPIKIFGNTGQGYAFSDCLARSRNRHQWLAFIDVDEFLVLYEPGQRNISEFLRQYEQYGALGVNWRVFGSSGHIHKPAASTLESYTSCVPDGHKENVHIKTIANVPYTAKIGGTPHHFEFYPGYYSVNELFRPCNLSWSIPASHTRIGLHHYVLKSLDEYKVKMQRGGGSGSVKGINFFQLIDSWSNATCPQAVEHGKQCFGSSQSHNLPVQQPT